MAKSWFIETEVFLLHEIVVLLDGLARKRVLEPLGLTYSEFLVAMSAREFDAPTQSEVGFRLEMSKSLVSQRVASLVQKDILCQRRDPANRRQVRLELTKNGAVVTETIYRQLADNAEEIFEVLGPSRPDFRQSLLRLSGTLATKAVKEGARAGGHPLYKPSE
jgi:MarR family transcriptional regulator, organic hydroperoxide resistance regulator